MVGGMVAMQQFAGGLAIIIVAALIFNAAEGNVEFGATADWVAGLGTVAGVWAAIWAANRQVGAQQRAVRQARIDQLNGIGDAGTLAFKSFDQVKRGLSAKDLKATVTPYWVIEGQNWSALKRFVAMPIECWPSATLFTRALAFEQSLDRFSTALAQFDVENRLYPDLADWTNISKAKDAFDTAYLEFETVLSGLLLA